MVRGEINFTSASQLASDALEILAEKEVNCIDFSKVSKANSAALALILEWQRFAKSHQLELCCCNLPATLQNMAKVSEVEFLVGASCG